MIVAWRLAKARHAATAFTGEGGRYAAGRWHHRGDRIVYTASSLALAALELLVHLGRADSKIAFVAFSLEIPRPVRVGAIALAELPAGWRSEPPIEATMKLGSEWLQASKSAVMKVPSAVVPTEHNYLLNPAHADFAKIAIGAAQPFTFDARLWK